MADTNIYCRQFRLNLAKESHRQVYQIIKEAESSGNQLLIDALLYYHKHMVEKDGLSMKTLVNEENEEEDSVEVEPDYSYLSI